jgi:hypothetical protein
MQRGATMQNTIFPITVTLAGDSIWDYAGPKTVTISDIGVYESDDYTSVEVEHDTTWNIYTDTGFESAVSAVLGYDVQFTEQGMQADGCASMELA